MLLPRYVISCDWLQLFGTLEGNFDESKTLRSVIPLPDGNFPEFYFQKAHEFMHGYRRHVSVCWKGADVCSLSWQPADNRIRRDGCALKVSNNLLYYSEWWHVLVCFIDCVHFRFNNITRVDLCCDFNSFERGLLPQTFIRDYIFKKGKQTYVRIGSNNGVLHFSTSETQTNFNTLRFGSRQSGVSVYLYNKSLEMRQQKFKPYIVELWKLNGLSYLDPRKPVYRLEISISSKGLNLLQTETGEIFKLLPQFLSSEQRLLDIFQIFANKFFRFKVVDTTRPLVKRQNLPDAVLFDFSGCPSVRPRTLYRFADSGRTERLIEKRLRSAANTLQGDDSLLSSLYSSEKKSLEDAARVFGMLSFMKQFENEFGKLPEDKQTPELRASLLRLRSYEHFTKYYFSSRDWDFISKLHTI